MQNDKLIIVEDEILIAKNIENILKDYGFDVVYICDNGKDAIEKARELKPALMLMDIMLKGKMDGVDAAEYVYNRLNIPVVFLTAFGDDITLNRAKIAEPYGFLLKPITDGVLKTTIEVAIQKHKLESKVRENEEWLSFILKNIDYAVLVIQSDLKVSFANPAALTLLNKSQEEIINKNVKDLFMLMENDKNIVFEEILGDIRDKNEKFEFLSRYYLICERENKIPVDGSAMPLWSNTGSFSGIILMMRDINIQKKMETENLRFEKIESLSLIAGGIAHDFNNMLTVIIGNLAQCRQKDLTPDEIDNYLDESSNAILRAKELTRQLMAFSKGGTLSLNTHDIRKIIKSIASFIMHGSGINLVYEFPEKLDNVSIDETQIEQVLQNVILNAREAMSDGSTLTISAENYNFNGAGIPLNPGDYVKILIHDTGPGINDDDIKRIFDPYFTTKPNGTGLGLPTAYTILKNHGGFITVDSIVKKGTTFTIYLPVSKKQVK
jgi:PAS domain S-box-containing protein